MTGDATPWWEGIGALILTLLICVIAFVAVFSIIYFALPKKFRARNLRFRLPLVFGAVQAVLWFVLLRDADIPHSPEIFFYALLNAPVVLLAISENLNGWINQLSPSGMDGVFPALVAALYWMLATFLIGFWIDHRRAKKALSVPGLPSPTPGQQP